jgi:tight adherence protein B
MLAELSLAAMSTARSLVAEPIAALAMAFAAVSASLLARPPDVLAARLGLRPGRRSRQLPRRVRPTVALLGGAITGGVLAGAAGVVMGGAAGIGLLVWEDRRRAAQTIRRREGDVADACLALAGQLAAGVPAEQALVRHGHDWPELFAHAAGQVAVGGDLGVALRESARQPGAAGLSAVAAAWEVAEQTGARLSATLIAVADSVRADAAVRREAEAQLASVRATARLMAVLPLVTLAVFSGGDGDAVRFLTHTPYGLACAGLAAAFVAAGLFWVHRVARSTSSAWAP